MFTSTTTLCIPVYQVKNFTYRTVCNHMVKCSAVAYKNDTEVSFLIEIDFISFKRNG